MYHKVKAILGLLVVLYLSAMAAPTDSLIPVTRNLDPVNHPVPTWAEYQALHPPQPTMYHEVNRCSAGMAPEPERTERTLLIIVESGLNPLIATSLATYQLDLQLQQLASVLVAFSGSSAEDLRDLILDYDDMENLAGVFLIGDLPVAWFEMYHDFDDNGIPDEDWMAEFPIELFFSDLDGLWADSDFNGRYDFHGGGVEPDIWIGRIKAENLSYAQASEAALINRYFDRNHDFRLGLLQANETALAYVDDDWAEWGLEFAAALSNCWQQVDLINDINATNAQDYRSQRLPAAYEYIQVMVHSGPDAHFFYWNDHQDYEIVYNYELHPINPTAWFYNLFACSNAHYEADNNMGSLYLLDNDYCLVSVGSTKTGSMLYFEDYYTPLGADSTFGAAMQLWWSQNVDVPGSPGVMWQRSWFYGMVTLGDPALKAYYPVCGPEALRIHTFSNSVMLDWDDLPGALGWRVYSAATPYGAFTVDESGVFNGSSWLAPRPEDQRYYRVTAILP